MEQQAYAVAPEQEGNRRRSLLGDATRFRRTAFGLCLIEGPLAALVGGLGAPWEGTEETAAWPGVLSRPPTVGS